MVEVFAVNVNRDMKEFEFEKLLRLVSEEKKREYRDFVDIRIHRCVLLLMFS